MVDSSGTSATGGDVGWTSADPAPAGSSDVLGALVGASGEGLVVVDGHPRVTGLNAAAASILGHRAADLLGRPAPAHLAAAAADVPAGRRRTSWPTADDRRRDVDYRVVELPDGNRGIWFTDVTGAVRQQERLTAITRAASTVADACSLPATLDAVAAEIRMTANIAAVQIKVIADPHEELRIMGTSGFLGDASDFTERLAECRRLGAQVMFLEALRTCAPIVAPHRKAAIMADPAWEPLHALMDGPDWDGFVAMPMVVRGAAVGVINAYYFRGESPGPRSLAFLEAMAAHAAVAIDTASLLARSRSQAHTDERRRLARDLHDSVVQQVFSMRLQAEALRAQVDRPDADPRRVRDGAEELALLSRDVLTDLRGLVFELRPLDLVERGLVGAVRAHAAGVQERTGLQVEVRAEEDLQFDVSVDVQEDLFRIVQEALHNVVKHARATRVEIRLALSPDRDQVRVDVRDDGCGTDGSLEDGRQRLGLISMRERTDRWSGRLLAGPLGAGGWSVAASVPLAGRTATAVAAAQPR